jgi:prepilin-type N-terminal cleavage/methylation domain-containing protein
MKTGAHLVPRVFMMIRPGTSDGGKGFTLVELLTVIAVLGVLMAVMVPSVRLARELSLEADCQSNLRQLGIILRTYSGDHDGVFPNPLYLYHSERSFTAEPGPLQKYAECCRWHDPRIGLDSDLMQEQPGLRGSLVPYIGDPGLLLCKVGERANTLHGCINACGAVDYCFHDANIPFEAQYTYTMNGFLGMEIKTWKKIPPFDEQVIKNTTRTSPVYRMTQVTRSPAQVFAFGEENSWRVAIVRLPDPNPWPPPPDRKGTPPPRGGGGGGGGTPGPVRHIPNAGTIRLPALCIDSTASIPTTPDSKDLKARHDNFATYHRPPGGDDDAGHSYAVMLDGHTMKITVADQVRSSIGSEGVPSQYGTGGNLALAWPIDIPPPGGWDKQ